jgi:hypothetical protein
MSPVPGADAVLNIIHDEFKDQGNVEEWEPYGLNMDTYRVFEQNIVIKLKVKHKWPRFRNEPLSIPRIFDFQNIWRDDKRTEFESNVVQELRTSPNGRQILKLDWQYIIQEADGFGSNTATCFIELALPESRKPVEKRVAHSSEDHDERLSIDKNIEKIYNLVVETSHEKSDDGPIDIDSLPDPSMLSYETDGNQTSPDKVEHVQRVQYQLNLEEGEFEKEASTKTYVSVNNINLSEKRDNIKLNYEE